MRGTFPGILTGIVLTLLHPAGLSAVSDTENNLLAVIEAVEKTDADIAAATRSLQTASSAAEKNHLKGRIQGLQALQVKQIETLEALAGPLPPRVRSEPRILLEERVKTQERRHETTLESNVDRRFSR